jgi:hypothetical protein
MSKTLLMLAALLFVATASKAQDPATPPAQAPPAEAPPAPPAEAKPADAPPAAPAAEAPPAAAPAAPAAEAPAAAPAAPAAEAPAAPAADEKKPCGGEDIQKAIDAALDAVKASPANGHAGGNFRKAGVQLKAAKKAVDAGCKFYMKPAKKKPVKGKGGKKK